MSHSCSKVKGLDRARQSDPHYDTGQSRFSPGSEAIVKGKMKWPVLDGPCC